jgi:hypothetical protein
MFIPIERIYSNSRGRNLDDYSDSRYSNIGEFIN